MHTLREKITFMLTALAYVLFHLGKAPDSGSILVGTTMALLNTLPYELGLSYMIVVFIRRTSGGKWPPWDRILRIFFTVGIVFGLIYSLYVRGALEQERRERQVSVTRFWEDDIRRGPLYSA